MKAEKDGYRTVISGHCVAPELELPRGVNKQIYIFLKKTSITLILIN